MSTPGVRDSTIAGLSGPAPDAFVNLQPDAFIDSPLGGQAILVQQVDGTKLPGRHWLLATSSSTKGIRIWDQTPRVPAAAHRGWSETVSSNLIAHGTAEKLTGVDLPLVDFTTAGGGGTSGGLVYLIAYLDLASGGAFTNGLSIAATGALGRNGVVQGISNVRNKYTTAYATDADVFFSSNTVPVEQTAVMITAPARSSFKTAANAMYRAGKRGYGHDVKPVVVVSHIGLVAAYLCGTGSSYACDITRASADFTYKVPREHTASALKKVLGK